MKDNNPQKLNKMIRIYGHEFIINMDGYVETTEFNCLGHIADCQDFAALIYDLMEIFETSSEI